MVRRCGGLAGCGRRAGGAVAFARGVRVQERSPTYTRRGGGGRVRAAGVGRLVGPAGVLAGRRADGAARRTKKHEAGESVEVMRWSGEDPHPPAPLPQRERSPTEDRNTNETFCLVLFCLPPLSPFVGEGARGVRGRRARPDGDADDNHEFVGDHDADPAAGAGPSPPRRRRGAVGCPLTPPCSLSVLFPRLRRSAGWVALVPLLVLVRLPGRPKTPLSSCFVAAMAFPLGPFCSGARRRLMMYFAWMILAPTARCTGPSRWRAALARSAARPCARRHGAGRLGSRLSTSATAWPLFHVR